MSEFFFAELDFLFKRLPVLCLRPSKTTAFLKSAEQGKFPSHSESLYLCGLASRTVCQVDTVGVSPDSHFLANEPVGVNSVRRVHRKAMNRLRFRPLQPHEQELGMALTQFALGDEDVVRDVSARHEAGERCAVVCLADEADGFVADQAEIQKRFPFPAVIESLSSYDPIDSVCLIIVREGLVSVSIIGRMA
jgi:hypothetical protein